MRPEIFLRFKTEPEKGCVKIYYRDYEISCTTISTIPEIIIFDKNGEDITEIITGQKQLYFSLESLYEIKIAIDKLTE